MLKIIFSSLYLVFGLVLFGQTTTTVSQKPQNAVQRAIDAFAADPYLASAGISFKAVNLTSGNVVGVHNGKMALPPASTVKLFTTATAFQLLGAYHRPVTRLYVSGDIDSNGVVHGDLYIRGGGDPTLGSKYFTKNGEEQNFLYDWADTLKKMGITKIEGSVIGDASVFGYTGAPSGWQWGDMGNYYGSGPSGLTLYDNMIKLHFSTGTSVGDSTHLNCILPYVPGLKMRNDVSTGSSKKDNSYIFGAPYGLDRFIQGTLPRGQKDFIVKGSIPDPEFQMAFEFSQVLSESGIEVKYASMALRTAKLSIPKDSLYKTGFKEVYKHKGKDVRNIASWVNLKSVNLYAEHLLCLIGKKKHSVGSTWNGAQSVMSYWAKKVGTGLNITDGSGLSRSNAISANHFTRLLKYMHTAKNGELFKKTLPIAGKTGTLKSVCKGQSGHGRILAKSGTMNKVKAYSGYVNSKSGKKLAFAIIVNNHTCSNRTLVKKMEKVFNAMAVY